MDYRALLFDPIFTIQGVSVKLRLANGLTLNSLTALDKTAGLDTGENVNVPTLHPAAVFRREELSEYGLAPKDLPDAILTMNEFDWKVESYKPKPSANGENYGEVIVWLTEKRARKTMTPATYDFTIVRGTTTPFTFSLVTTDENDNETPIFFDDIRISFYSGSELLFRKTFVDGDIVITDSESNEVECAFTAEESREFPIGPESTYEVEVRYESAQDVYLIGTITGVGGLNDD